MNTTAYPHHHSRRHFFLMTGFFLIPLSACEAKPMPYVTLDVVLFSYLRRPIFNVYLNGQVGDGSMGYPATGGSTTVGVRIPLGPQKLTWTLSGPEGMARNGEVINAKNALLLSAADISKGDVFLAVHIYPDDTAELLASMHYPDFSTRGLAFVKERK